MTDTPTGNHEVCTMSSPMLIDAAKRTELLNRLKRAEGQLRGIQRMIEEDQSCMDIAAQMAAVRRALDGAYVRMTVCYMQQELQQRLQLDEEAEGELDTLLDDVQTLLGKVR